MSKSSPMFEKPCRILIADDEAPARKQLKRLLEKELAAQQIGVVIETVETIEEAKQKLKEAGKLPFDVLVLDSRFSSLGSGTSLLDWLKSEALEIDTEVIMLTGYPITSLQEQVLELGAYFYADKASVLSPGIDPKPDGSGSFLSPKAFVFLVKNCVERLRLRRRRGKVIELVGRLHEQLRHVAGEVNLDRYLEIVVNIPNRINEKIHKAAIRMPTVEPGSGIKLKRVARVVCKKCELEGQVGDGPELSEDEGIVGHVYSTGEPYRCNSNIDDDEYFVRSCPHTKAELCVPLKIGNRVIGVLNLESDHEEAFCIDDISAMQMVAEVASPSIRNAVVFRTIMKMAEKIVRTVGYPDKDYAAEQVAAFNSIRSEQIAPLFASVLEGALQLTNATLGAIYMYDRKQGKLYLAKEEGMGPGTKNKIEDFFNNKQGGICPLVASTGQTKRTTGDAQEDFELWDNYAPFLDKDRVIKSFLCVPIKLGDTVFGVVDLEDRKPEKFSYLDQVVVEAFANMAASALANAALVVSLKERQEADRVKARSQERAELFAVFAHDLKAPLNFLALLVSRCIQLHGTARFEDLGGELLECQANLKRATHEIDLTLEAAKEAGHLENLELRPILEAAWNELRPSFPNYQMTMAGDFSAHAVQVQGTPLTIKLVIKELIKNAAEAAQGKGELIIACRRRERHECVTFQDNGPGIRPEDREKIFELGYTTKGSSGQGLARSQRIITFQLGSLTLDNTCTSGARFILCLPIPLTGA